MNMGFRHSGLKRNHRSSPPSRIWMLLISSEDLQHADSERSISECTSIPASAWGKGVCFCKDEIRAGGGGGRTCQPV